MLGKRIAELLEDMRRLTRERHRWWVAGSLPPPGARERPSQTTVGMDSKLEKAWSCIHEEGIGIVGIYGLGGVGKTTLVK